MRHIIYDNHGTIQETDVSTEELFETIQFLNSCGYTIIKIENRSDTIIPFPVHPSVKETVA